MISIFSETSYKEGKEYVYDCSINEDDLVKFTYGSSNNSPSIDEIISSIIIDFPTLRTIIYTESKDDISCEIIGKYSKYLIEQNNNFIRIENNKKENILLSKKFLMDAYEILKNMWEEEEEK